MTQYEAASLVGLVSGPLLAVLVTLWHQDRAQRRQAKQQLFFTLMAHRRATPPPLEWVNALNLIDVVYGDHPKVVELWHRLYGILCQKEITDWQAWNHTHLELLSEMAKTLGYKGLKQTDIDKFYSPVAHGDVARKQSDIANELLRVLKSTECLSVSPRLTEETN